MADHLDDQIADRIIEVMNRMLESDPVATGAILRTRYDCNQRLADDPTIQVAGGRGPPTVGLLGILNGLSGVLPPTSKRAGWGRVTSVFEVLCPMHGEGLEANDESKVGGPCMLVGCTATLELGSLVRFERTEKKPGRPPCQKQPCECCPEPEPSDIVDCGDGDDFEDDEPCAGQWPIDTPPEIAAWPSQGIMPPTDEPQDNDKLCDDSETEPPTKAAKTCCGPGKVCGECTPF